MVSLDLSLLRKEKVEIRDYQLKAAERLFEAQKLLVVMPTALGKTFIAILAIAHLLKTQPKKILFLAPTKPLVLQQAKRLQELIDTVEETAVVTGEVSPEARKKQYVTATVICATPQTINNDLKKGLLSLHDFALVVFDEAHRAVGDYAYVPIGERVKKTGSLVLALTASPSSDKKKVAEVCLGLGINAIEVKTLQDEEVQQFANDVKVFWEFVDLPPELVSLRSGLKALLAEPVGKLGASGFMSAKENVSRKELLMLRQKFLGLSKRNPSFYQLLSVVAKAMNLAHAIDLLESEGVRALYEFLHGFNERKSQTRAVAQLAADPRIKIIEKDCEALLQKDIDHPKMVKLKEIVSKTAGSKKTVIVFAHYRDSVTEIVSQLNSLPGVKAKSLVGRAGGGMNQKQQHGVVESFRDSEFNVLVATSVGEEGLDIPSVDLVIFYEAVPSEIRLIQRRGRAGRAKVGEAVVLVTKGTKDEAYLWLSRQKEKTMLKHMRHLQGSSRLQVGEEPSVEEIPGPIIPEKPKKKGQTSMSDFLG